MIWSFYLSHDEYAKFYTLYPEVFFTLSGKKTPTLTKNQTFMTIIKFFLAHMNHQAGVGNTKMHPPYSLLNFRHYLVSVSDRITKKVGLIAFLMTVKLGLGILALKNLPQQSDVSIAFWCRLSGLLTLTMIIFQCFGNTFLVCVYIVSVCVCSGLTDLHVAYLNLWGTDVLRLCSFTFLFVGMRDKNPGTKK